MARIYQFLAAFTFVLTATGVFAQTKDETREAVLLSVSKVETPKEAIETGLGGRVSVLVAVDDAGKVTAVEVVMGPDWVCPAVERPDVVALRNSAKAAALNAKFSPALREGKPIASSLRIEFQFPRTADTIKGDPLPDSPHEKDKEQNLTIVGEPLGRGVQPSSPAKDDVERFKESPAGLNGGGPRGVLNSKATVLVTPPYPAAARAVRASGSVVINVLIDLDGTVFSAEPVSGHPLLRSSSRAAACNSKFSPTTLQGEPVKVSGLIIYNFTR